MLACLEHRQRLFKHWFRHNYSDSGGESRILKNCYQYNTSSPQTGSTDHEWHSDKIRKGNWVRTSFLEHVWKRSYKRKVIHKYFKELEEPEIQGQI